MINIIKILIVMGPLLFFSKVEGAAAAASQMEEEPDGIRTVKGVFTRLSEGPLPDVIVDEGALSTFQFKANLCRELSSFFGRQHLRIEETADPSAALLAVKFTFTVATLAAGAAIPAGTFLIPGIVGTGQAIVTALSDELKTQVAGLIASVPERDLLRTGGGGFFFTTTFGEIDQLCRIISTEITDIYRPFIERLESKSAISFAKVAGNIIKYYVGSQSLFEERRGGKYTTPSELVLAVAQFHPLTRPMGVGLFNRTEPSHNSLKLKTRNGNSVWALDILQGSRIQVGAVTYRSKSEKYYYFKRPWNENGIVYTKAPDRHVALEEAFGEQLVRTATRGYKDTLEFVLS